MAEEKKEEAAAATTTTEEPKAQVAIQRIYNKDLSFEAPGAPGIFRQEWKPELTVEIDTTAAPLEENFYESIIAMTITVKNADAVAFIVEVKQAGIFTLTGFEGEQLEHALHVFCPSVIFPYARELVSGVVGHGGFPQLLLAPVNFDAVFAQKRAQAAGK